PVRLAHLVCPDDRSGISDALQSHHAAHRLRSHRPCALSSRKPPARRSALARPAHLHELSSEFLAFAIIHVGPDALVWAGESGSPTYPSDALRAGEGTRPPYTFNSATVAPPPPSCCGGSETDSTCGCCCKNCRSAFRRIPMPLPWTMRTRGSPARNARSTNVSTSRVASSTVCPITLI